MKSRAETISEMMIGTQPLAEYWAGRKLNFRQTLQVVLSVFLLLVLKYTYRPVRRLFKGKFDVTKGLDRHSGLVLKNRGHKRQETHGGHYLSEVEVAEFERSGIHGPFKVMEPEEARALGTFSYDLYAKKFDNQYIIGEEENILKVLEETGFTSINHLSVYQALNYGRLWEVLCRPELTQRLASLLGDDVICWRSQFFEKKAGAEATSWHQAGTFREASDRPKLTPPPGMGQGMVQLSGWIALTDVTIPNGCLRMVEGSHEDGRLERLAWTILDNKLKFLLEQSPRMIYTIIKTLKYTPGVFHKTQMLFEMVVDMLPDLFEGMEVRTLEMKAGEAIIFTSLNVHGSYPNVTDRDRLALSGRFTSNDVQLYKDQEFDSFPTPKGKMKFRVDKVRCIQVHGEDRFGHNAIAEVPSDGWRQQTVQA